MSSGYLALNPFTTEARFLCAECYGIQHIKTGFSGERVECHKGVYKVTVAESEFFNLSCASIGKFKK